MRGGQRQLLVAGRCAAPHRLDRSQARPRERVAEQRGERDRERPADREGRDQPGQHLVAILERLADDDHVGTVGARQHTRGAVDARHALLAAHGLDWPARSARGVEDPAVVRLDLREAVLGVAGDAGRRAGRRHGRRPCLERRVHGLVEIRAQLDVDERRGGDEHDRGGRGERQRQADTDRHAAHLRSR